MKGEPDRASSALCEDAKLGRRCIHRKCNYERRWQNPEDYEKIAIDDTTGVVEIPIKEFVKLMLRMDKVLTRIDEFFAVIVPEIVDAEEKPDGTDVSIEEFIALAVQYLDEADKICGLFRYEGKWRHVRNDGRMRGKWSSVDDAMEETSCRSKCAEEMFRPA